MSSSPHRCDTCDANCNFTIPSGTVDDQGIPRDSRVYVRNLRLAVNDLYDTLIVKGNYGTQDVNEIITDMELLLDRFRDVYNFFKSRK